MAENKVTVRTVARWAASGRLPIAMKLPGERGANLYLRSDVERVLKGVAA